MKKEIIEIQEEVKIVQDNQEVILEKGDKIQILEATFNEDRLNNDLISLLNDYIQGYGESGPLNTVQYFDVMRYILGFIANDFNDAIFNEFDLFTEKDILVAKTHYASPLKNFQRYY